MNDTMSRTTHLRHSVDIARVLAWDGTIITFIQCRASEDRADCSSALVSSTPARINDEEFIALLNTHVVSGIGTARVALATRIIACIDPVGRLVEIAHNASARGSTG